MLNQSKLPNLSKSTSLKTSNSLSIQNTTKTTARHLETIEIVVTETKIVDTITVIGTTEAIIAEMIIIAEAATVMAIKVEGTTTAEGIGTTITVVMIEEETGSKTLSVTLTETLGIRKWKTHERLPRNDAIKVAKTEEIETVADQDLDPETMTAVTTIEATTVTLAETTIVVAEMTSTVGVEDVAEVGVAIDSRWKSQAAISLEAVMVETSATTTETPVETTTKRVDTTTEMTGTINQDIEAHPNTPFESDRAAEEAAAGTTSKMRTTAKSLNKANEEVKTISL